MKPATPNPILAVTQHGFAPTPLGVAAARAGWPVMVEPTTRELLRSIFTVPHHVVLVEVREPDGPSQRLLDGIHASSRPVRVVAVGAEACHETERRARSAGVFLYLNNEPPERLIDAARSLLPKRLRTYPSAPVVEKHPAPADPAIAPRAHLARLMAHPPPARAGPARGSPRGAWP